MKGLTKVRAEWSLMTLAYNLRRALNLVPLAKLLAAVAAQAAQPPPTPAPA